MSTTKFLKVKKRCLVYYSLPDQKRYNEKSKINLKQNHNNLNKSDKKVLSDLIDVKNVDCINSYSNEFLSLYSSLNGRDYKRFFSKMQQKKISDSTNTFIDVVVNNYRRSKGLNQRMITFVTLTIPENQKHTDKVMVKTLIDFIDHLKKVKNTLVSNKVDTGQELLVLQNYVWRAETTEAGNIHFHLLFDTYVNHITLKRVWNNYLSILGYVGGENSANIHNLNNINDVGGYITKYLTKDPLNNEFNELLKSGQIKHSDLNNYEPEIKFRRPVLYTSWGCSRVLKKLSSLTFSGDVVPEFNELRDKCEKIELKEEIRDFIKVYKGKIYELINTCAVKIKSLVRSNLNNLFDHIYLKSDDERKYLDDTIWLNRQNFEKSVFDTVVIKSRPAVSFIPNLF